MGNMAFATMAGKRQMLCASTFKRFRQVRPGGGNRAFAVHPNGVGKLFRREKVGQSFEASGMGKIIRRAGNDADLSVVHVVLSLGSSHRCYYI
ncbi:Uncharacterised protein [Salmonella enterica subsp. enterica serovar Bovismorbificans]|uniref:Uncharacterized protein n=1 Tax=Salmonella enterica subsp. enterica serovar Bovismorbificans TaxID=58097 RepID=A0A655BP88_SALET|nr:Uncharacterised protein [Salmonella enterica subsp. enterica serovar Bovismorbificans]CPR63823.1 Uncharacterised protein [Salmonella enterica subsp. enterica serovar Bovismorbificans]